MSSRVRTLYASNYELSMRSSKTRPASALHWRPRFSCTNNTPFSTLRVRVMDRFPGVRTTDGCVPILFRMEDRGWGALFRIAVAHKYSVPARLNSAAISAWLTASHPNSEVKVSLQLTRLERWIDAPAICRPVRNSQI